jgi:peptide/nickel transport system permease protein
MSTASVGTTEHLAAPVAELRNGRAADLWRAVTRNRKAVAGVLILLVFVVLAIFPGQIAPDDPQAEIFLPGQGASWHHLLGTTAYGQDIFSQLVWGTRLSIVIALAVGALATALAVLVGVSAAYLGGVADGVLSLVTDVILVIPIFPLVIVIAAYRKNAGLFTLVVVLGASCARRRSPSARATSSSRHACAVSAAST